VGGTPKVREETGMSSLAGRFLFKMVPLGEVEEAEEAEKTEGGLGRRRRKGEEGEEEAGAAEGEEQEEAVLVLEGLRWERESERDSGEEEMMEGLEQKREEEGEKTGELETATEQDMAVLSQNSNVGIGLLFVLCVVILFGFCVLLLLLMREFDKGG